jgi:tocopherol O-methyltransferase
VILPRQTQTTDAVAAHYDELDSFYREIWGEHVHHGYWATGRETPAEAAVSLLDLLADRLRLEPGLRVCDIGCGYGAAARYLAETHALDVVGVTISAAQARRAQIQRAQAQCAEAQRARARRPQPPAPTAGSVTVRLQDWLANDFAPASFDRAYAVESSEHMPDKQGFFHEAFRTLKPNGLLAVCAWLSRTEPAPWEIRHLLEPICREGRLPSMGDETDYRRLGERAGFRVVQVEDLSRQVSRTWWICIRRGLLKLATRPRYVRFLLDKTASNRIFAVTLFRIMIAYRTRSMRYCVLLFRREA